MLMKMKEWDDAIYYRIGCDCCDPDHDLAIWAESDKEGHFPAINLTGQLHTRLWVEKFTSPWLKWLNDPYNRIVIAAKVLLMGYTTVSLEFSLGKENIAGLRTALDEIERKLYK